MGLIHLSGEFTCFRVLPKAAFDHFLIDTTVFS